MQGIFIIKMIQKKQTFIFMLAMLGILLSSCSKEPFHLRGSVALPEVYQQIFLEGEVVDSPFGKVLKRKLAEVGSQLVADRDKATAVLQVKHYQEGKRVAGYGSNREVREYLIYIRFDFETKSISSGRTLTSLSRVNLDKLQIYDSAFVLGKIEEERLIKEDLRNNAVRQVLLRLQYGS